MKQRLFFLPTGEGVDSSRAGNAIEAFGAHRGGRIGGLSRSVKCAGANRSPDLRRGEVGGGVEKLEPTHVGCYFFNGRLAWYPPLKLPTPASARGNPILDLIMLLKKAR